MVRRRPLDLHPFADLLHAAHLRRCGRGLMVGLAILATFGCRSAADTSPTSAAAAEPPELSAAWAGVEAQIDREGIVTAETAVQAFSLAFGPLSGGSLEGVIPSGTAALRWIVAYWDAITPEQRESAVRLFPDLAEINEQASTGSHGLAHLAAPPSAGGAVAPSRSDSEYTEMARAIAEDIENALDPPQTLGITIDAHLGSIQALAATSVVNTNGGKSGTAAKCEITVGPATDALIDDRDVGMVMAREVWHCFQGDLMDLAWYWGLQPEWIVDGQAEWVGASMFSTAGMASVSWPAYLVDPGTPLFQRGHSAVGFYSQLDSSGTDPWSRLVPMLMASSSSPSAFQAANADQAAFLDQWASGYLRDVSRGADWDMVGPGITPDIAVPAALQVANGASVSDSAAPYANHIAVLAQAPEVLLATYSGNARISDAVGHDYRIADGGNFCLRANGCKCPQGDEGKPQLRPLEASSVALAVTGGTNGANGTLAGLSLKDFCGPTIAGTWQGTWANDNGRASGGFVLVATQKGKTFSGTIEVSGPTCVRQGTVQGSIDGTNVSWGVVGAERDIDFVGTLAGDSMSGGWSAIACGPPYGPANVTITVTGVWEATRQE
jgi:hypothetical protein